MKKNVLVTGAGAVLGQGILRSLNNMNNNNIIIHSADPDFRSTGHWLANKAHTIHFANHPDYINLIKEIIEKEAIDVIMIGTDTELPVFAMNKEGLEKSTNVKIVVSNTNVIDIANDKWKTAEFLKEAGFDYPQSVMANDREAVFVFIENNKFPYFAKPVDGARSKGIVVINSEDAVTDLLADPRNLVIQEFLPENEGEFTSGCVVINGKCKAVVTLRRDLRDGNTYRAYYSNEYSKYNVFISSVAEKLGVAGPCNFQFRIRNGKPVVFEINARFSGTTPIRYMFGFNEVEAILLNIIEGKDIEEPQLREGMVMRAWSDLFVDITEIARFQDNKSIHQPQATFYAFTK